MQRVTSARSFGPGAWEKGDDMQMRMARKTVGWPGSSFLPGLSGSLPEGWGLGSLSLLLSLSPTLKGRTASPGLGGSKERHGSGDEAC